MHGLKSSGLCSSYDGTRSPTETHKTTLHDCRKKSEELDGAPLCAVLGCAMVLVVAGLCALASLGSRDRN